MTLLIIVMLARVNVTAVLCANVSAVHCANRILPWSVQPEHSTARYGRDSYGNEAKRPTCTAARSKLTSVMCSHIMGASVSEYSACYS